MLGFLKSHPQSLDEILENQEIGNEELVGFENDLGFSLEDIFDNVKKVKSLPTSDLSTLKGRGSAVSLENGKITLKFKHEPDLPALARNGVYAKMIEEDNLHGNDFEDFVYTEFVASLAEEKLQRTELTQEDRLDFEQARDHYHEKKADAVDAVLEGATVDDEEDLLELERIEEIGEKESKIRDKAALVDLVNFSNLDTMYDEFVKSDWLEHRSVRGSSRNRKNFEEAATTYQLAKGVIVAREAAREYIERGGGLAGEENEVMPVDFLEPSEGLYHRTMDYLERAEDAFNSSPLKSVDIDTTQ